MWSKPANLNLNPKPDRNERRAPRRRWSERTVRQRKLSALEGKLKPKTLGYEET